MQDVVEHFSARTLFSSSPPTLFGPLAAPSCQSLSGQLTRSCRAFPATRASGKRPSVALFDVPSTLILFTWTAFCAHFLSTEAPLTFLFFAFSAQHSSFHFSIFPVTLTSSIPDTDEAPLWIYIIYIRVYFLFSFLDFFTFLFLHIRHAPCLQLFGCQHGGQIFWRCLAQMPYFPSIACLELWFVRNLACRAHFLLFSGKRNQSTNWWERQEQDVIKWSGKWLWGINFSS